MDEQRLENPLGKLLEFLDKLEEIHVRYDLKHVRDSVMIKTYIPAGMWEIEFFEDGTIEVEFFRRQGDVESVPEAWLDKFIEENSD